MRISKCRKFITITIMFIMGCTLAIADGGTLPFFRDMAGDRDMPLPFGVGVTYFQQSQAYNLKSFSLDNTAYGLMAAAGIDPAATFGILEAMPPEIENDIEAFNLKVDAWILPFMNAFLILGTLDGETSVKFPAPLQPVLGPSLDFDLAGTVYGGGILLAYGTEHFFGSLNSVLTETGLDISDSSITTVIVSPRIGGCIGPVTAWVGAMYQDVEETHKGDISIPILGPQQFGYEAEMNEDSEWNTLVGLGIALLDKRLTLEVEVGFGDRDHTSIGIGGRF